METGTVIGNTIFREEALARRSRQEPLENRLRVTAAAQVAGWLAWARR